MITLMKIEVSPYSLLGKPEQGLNFFLKSKKEFPIRTEEPGRMKTPKGECEQRTTKN
jgi:hypothetical protein